MAVRHCNMAVKSGSKRFGFRSVVRLTASGLDFTPVDGEVASEQTPAAKTVAKLTVSSRA